MAPKPTAKSAEAARKQLDDMGIHEVLSWGEWKAGDRCGIEGAAGEYRIQGFRIFAPKLPDLVSVVGGSVDGQSQVKQFRTFTADRLTTKIIKRAPKRAPLPWEEEEDAEVSS